MTAEVLSTVKAIVAPTAAIGLIGVACGAALAAAAKFLAVEEDPRIDAAEEATPGVNCGGCGYAGCAEYAKAVVLHGAAIDLCAPGGAATIAGLAKLMGLDASAKARTVAMVMCGGNNHKAKVKHLYNGVADCKAAHVVGGGDKVCRHGCLGYGSCASACPVDAIEIRDGLAIVHEALCIGCGKCIRTCPRLMIKMIPADAKVHVLCNSGDKGPLVKQACAVGCIGCRICTKLTADAIAMEGFLAVVDYTKPIDDDTAVLKCPGKCMSYTGTNKGSSPAKVTTS